MTLERRVRLAMSNGGITRQSLSMLVIEELDAGRVERFLHGCHELEIDRGGIDGGRKSNGSDGFRRLFLEQELMIESRDAVVVGEVVVEEERVDDVVSGTVGTAVDRDRCRHLAGKVSSEMDRNLGDSPVSEVVQIGTGEAKNLSVSAAYGFNVDNADEGGCSPGTVDRGIEG